MGEARRQFRRVNGYLHLPALRAALDQTITAVTHSCHTHQRRCHLTKH
jgi:hypothetical protein